MTGLAIRSAFFSVVFEQHYSVLYDNAVNTIRLGPIGEIYHIRAQWNRGNLPGHDSWQPALSAAWPPIGYAIHFSDKLSHFTRGG